MRITLVTSKLNFETAGGSVLDLHLKAKSLVEFGHAVTVVTAFSHANRINQALPYAVQTEDISAPGWLAQQRGVYHLLKKYERDTDAYYIDGNTFVYGGGMYRLLGGTRPVTGFFNIKLSCFADTQNNDRKKQTPLARLKRKVRFVLEKYIGTRIANCLDTFVFTTPMVEKIYLDFGFDRQRSHIIPDFVNTAELSAREAIASRLQQHQTKPGPVTLFSSGRMIPEKGFDMIIRALARLNNKDHFRLIMSGGGPDLERLQALAQDLGVDQYITFPGWVKKEELKNFFLEAQVFILPKWWIEYSSVLLIEAMAYGLPCVVPGGGGLEWLAGGGARAFPDDSVEGLASAITELGGDGARRLALAQASLAGSGQLDYLVLGKKLEAILTRAA